METPGSMIVRPRPQIEDQRPKRNEVALNGRFLKDGASWPISNSYFFSRLTPSVSSRFRDCGAEKG